MGRIIYALMVVVALDLAMFLFGGTTFANNTLTSLVLNPASLFSSPFYLALVGAIGILVATTAISGMSGGAFTFTNVYVLYASLAVFMITFVGSIINFWGFLNSQLIGSLGSSSTIVSSLICVPLTIPFLMMIVDYVRGTE